MSDFERSSRPLNKKAPPHKRMNCLPFLGHEKWEAFYACRLEGEARHRGQEGGDRALRARPRLQVCGEGAVGPARNRETMALRIPVVRKRGAAIHGRQAGQVHIRAEGRRSLRRGRRRHDEGRGDGGVRHNVDVAAQEMVRALPPGGAEALRPRPKGRPSGSKARPRTREEELEERCRRLETEVAYLKKLRALVERDGL